MFTGSNPHGLVAAAGGVKGDSMPLSPISGDLNSQCSTSPYCVGQPRFCQRINGNSIPWSPNSGDLKNLWTKSRYCTAHPAFCQLMNGNSIPWSPVSGDLNQRCGRL